MDELLKAECKNVQELIKTHFSLDKWLELPITMQQRHITMTRNYITALAEGFEAIVPLPDYLEKKSKETKKEKAKKKGKIPTTTGNCFREHPKRNIPKKNYFEDEVPKDDRYVFCDTCQEEYIDSCPKCGALVSLKDVDVPMGIPDRAKKTVPDGILEVRPSPIHGLGVFALINLRKGVRLGPYVGKLTRVESSKGYSWKLRNGFLIDAGEENDSNYLRYVNCARNIQEQNLVAFQYKGEIYYRTCKNITKSEELLVFYGRNFATSLGIDTKKYFEPNQEELDDVYFCDFCCIGLSTKEFKDKHQKRCKFGKKRIVFEGNEFQCKFCCALVVSLDVLKRHEVFCSKKARTSLISNDNRKNRGEENCEANYGPSKGKVVRKKLKSNFEICRRSSLSNRRTLYEDVFSFKCFLCFKGFNTKRSLDYHLLKFHDDIQKYITRKIFRCDYCAFKTLNSHHLTCHNLRHDKENAPKYFCEKCQYRTIDKSDLKQHSLIHFEKQPYNCHTCQKRFVRKMYLDNHILMKHKEKLNQITSKIYACTFCNYKTVISTHLKLHRLNHSKENAQKFICHNCQYETYHKSSLNRHVLIHSREKPFPCDSCQKQFRQNGELADHILRRHKEKIYQITRRIYSCDICTYQTLGLSSFRRHKLKHLKIET